MTIRLPLACSPTCWSCQRRIEEALDAEMLNAFMREAERLLLENEEGG